MDVKEMRKYVINAYPNAGMAWKSKVSKMKNNQIIAIYRSIQARKAKEEKIKKQEQIFHQIDMFEYMAEL